MSSRNWLDRAVRNVSGESMLDDRPNGGTAIVRRSVRITVVLYVPALLLAALLETGIGFGIDWEAIRIAAKETLPWAGAIFGGSYAALYARFASQWSYLAQTYNQLMITQIQAPPGSDSERIRLYALWKAGIVEDAVMLHLATKPMFAPMIAKFLKEPEVVAAFHGTVVGAPEWLKCLEKSLSGVLKTEVRAAVPASPPAPKALGASAVEPEGGSGV